jgi:hypothetical protein
MTAGSGPPEDALLERARRLAGTTFERHASDARHPVLYSFSDAGHERSRYRELYAKAKREQWDAERDLPWESSVDPESPMLPAEMLGIYGSDVWEKLTESEQTRARHWTGAWMLSNFLHGERGALLATAQIVSCAPRTDQKLYASTQVQDEARHVEAYERYLREKMNKTYPPSPHLVALLDAILEDSRWDIKFLGMQILVEGLALAAFGWIRRFANEPLIQKIVTRIQQDEARHVAFGVEALKEAYTCLTDSERREREDFVADACRLLRDRFLGDEIWLEMGLPVERCNAIVLESYSMSVYRQMLFSRIVPDLKRIGLISDRLRPRLAELGILAFEDLPPDEGDVLES